MRNVLAVVAALAFVALSLPIQAQEIPHSCMVSFNVKDKAFSSGYATMSCRLVEAQRVQLSQQILTTPATGEIDGDAVAAKLKALEVELKKQEDAKNWLGIGEAVTGNALATIGLAACFETSGAGCVLAVVGKVMAIHAVIDAATSDADKTKNADALRAVIADLRTKVGGKKSKAKAARDQMIADANALCTAVKTNCL